MIYYGDEIGIEHNYNVSKDGGGMRTGARTPMQWTEARNKGFTKARIPYLPTDKKKGRSVEAQLKDENSVLNAVKELIKIRKLYPALNASSDQKFVEKGYPAVYERSNGDQTIIVLINPSNKPINRTVEFDRVLKAQNVEIKQNQITLKEQSFAILLK
jgi:maltose alpha-D-glucosyltransferase/alpha-amylase